MNLLVVKTNIILAQCIEFYTLWPRISLKSCYLNSKNQSKICRFKHDELLTVSIYVEILFPITILQLFIMLQKKDTTFFLHYICLIININFKLIPLKLNIIIII